MPLLPIRDRPPDADEFERLRLTLSGFRDGSGQLLVGGQTYPGWRDFERAVAAVFGGRTMESKGIFDVELPAEPVAYGVSCKTRAGKRTDDFVLMELSNSSAQFWRRLNQLAIDPTAMPAAAGKALIELIEEWHLADSGWIDLDGSSYLHLAHTQAWRDWRLVWYPLDLQIVRPERMEWTNNGARIVGRLDGRMIWEWYGQSGGQLKYYPPLEWARWVSDWFELEEPPVEDPAERAAQYWPDRWPRS